MLHQVVEVRNHHDAVAGGDAEQRDEADDRRHRQHAAGHEHADDAADHGQRQIEHHQQGIARGSEGDEQQQEDADGDRRAQQHQHARSLSRALELAAVFDVVAGRQLHVRRDPPANVVHHAGQVAPGHVGHHHHLALHVLAADRIRRAVVADIGQRRQRQARALGGRDQRRAHRFQAGPRRRVITQHQVVSRPPLAHLTHRHPGEGRLDGLRHLAHREAMPRQRVALEADGQMRNIGLLLVGDIHRPVHALHHGLDPLRQPTQFSQILAEYFHRDIRAVA